VGKGERDTIPYPFTLLAFSIIPRKRKKREKGEGNPQCVRQFTLTLLFSRTWIPARRNGWKRADNQLVVCANPKLPGRFLTRTEGRKERAGVLTRYHPWSACTTRCFGPWGTASTSTRSGEGTGKEGKGEGKRDPRHELCGRSGRPRTSRKACGEEEGKRRK